MKIGLFCDSFFPMIDGVAIVIDNYARLLSKEHDVTVFVSCPKDEPANHPYKVVACTRLDIGIEDYSMPLPKLDGKFMKALNESNLDIVHIHSPFIMGRLGIQYARKHHIPVIGTMHTQFRKNFGKMFRFKPLLDFLTRYVVKTFDRCDACYAVNGDVGRIFHEDYGYKEMPGVLPNATDLSPVPDKAASAVRVNERYGIAPDEPLLLFTGRINLLKGIDFIADALAVLRDRGVKFRMMYVGNGPDEQALTDKITALELNDRCILAGRITDRVLMADIYSRARLFLFPSYYDCSSLVQIEAASQGTPVLFCTGSATSQGVIPDVDGFIADYDAVKYADKIQQVLTDDDLRQRVSAQSQKDLWITWEQTVRNVAAIYQEQIDKMKV